MGLWIRTQNEGLHQIIGISEPIRVSDMFVLIGDNSCEKKRLGTYKTEQRALEVLYEIQEHIDNGYAETFVMPED